MKIGFFDSGLGGLTILKSVSQVLTEYDYEYFGDTQNLPYGDKSEAQIRSLCKTGIETLFKKDCLLVIVACNTASAESLRNIQDMWLPKHYPQRKILGMIVPTVEAVLQSGQNEVALLATVRTVESNKYPKELTTRSKQLVKLTQIATPELVPLIELNDLTAATQAASHRLTEQAGESTGVILGCTHYTQIKDQLRAEFGSKKQIFSQDEIIPVKLQSYLASHPEIETKLTKGGKRSIHLTQHRSDYDLIIGQLLGGAYVDQ